MGRQPVAERAVGLPWLRPTAGGLLALTDTPPGRVIVLDCPGTVAHILRYMRPTPDPSTLVLSDDLIAQPGVSAAAAEFVESGYGWSADWTLGGGTVLTAGRTAARVAAALATDTRLCTPDAAWVTALLVPLGWYAAGITLEAGFDPVTVGRRLAFRWRLPTQFAVTIGSLDLEPDDVGALGGHPGLHRVVRAAVAATERQLGSLGLVRAERSDAELDVLADDAVAGVRVEPAQKPVELAPEHLAKLLRLNAAARQRGGVAIVADLEAQIDALTRRVVDARTGFHADLRDAKLASLAEFAAGAGHEINNPLAVVSGNAQLLLAGEADTDRRRRLSAIMRAAGRISDILNGTRQFARPPAPTLSAVVVKEVLAAACADQRPTADERGVRLELAESSDDRLAAWADPKQCRQIVGNLIRNGVEAAPVGGWVRASADVAGDGITIAVEDSGPGPAPAAVPHLFDPFYCGRDAGRGRGLGLAQAWQLARQNGGAVQFAPRAGGPTRFTLTLPRADSPSRVEVPPTIGRQSA